VTAARDGRRLVRTVFRSAPVVLSPPDNNPNTNLTTWAVRFRLPSRLPPSFRGSAARFVYHVSAAVRVPPPPADADPASPSSAVVAAVPQGSAPASAAGPALARQRPSSAPAWAPTPAPPGVRTIAQTAAAFGVWPLPDPPGRAPGGGAGAAATQQQQQQQPASPSSSTSDAVGEIAYWLGLGVRARWRHVLNDSGGGGGGSRALLSGGSNGGALEARTSSGNGRRRRSSSGRRSSSLWRSVGGNGGGATTSTSDSDDLTSDDYDDDPNNRSTSAATPTPAVADGDNGDDGDGAAAEDDASCFPRPPPMLPAAARDALLAPRVLATARARAFVLRAGGGEGTTTPLARITLQPPQDAAGGAGAGGLLPLLHPGASFGVALDFREAHDDAAACAAARRAARAWRLAMAAEEQQQQPAPPSRGLLWGGGRRQQQPKRPPVPPPRARCLQATALLESHEVVRGPHARGSGGAANAAAADGHASPAAAVDGACFRTLHAEDVRVTAHALSAGFSFSLPDGGCPSFRTPMLEHRWVLRFELVLGSTIVRPKNKRAAGQGDSDDSDDEEGGGGRRGQRRGGARAPPSVSTAHDGTSCSSSEEEEEDEGEEDDEWEAVIGPASAAGVPALLSWALPLAVLPPLPPL
jgi:hypothetical protein